MSAQGRGQNLPRKAPRSWRALSAYVAILPCPAWMVSGTPQPCEYCAHHCWRSETNQHSSAAQRWPNWRKPAPTARSMCNTHHTCIFETFRFYWMVTHSGKLPLSAQFVDQLPVLQIFNLYCTVCKQTKTRPSALAAECSFYHSAFYSCWVFQPGVKSFEPERTQRRVISARNKLACEVKTSDVLPLFRKKRTGHLTECSMNMQQRTYKMRLILLIQWWFLCTKLQCVFVESKRTNTFKYLSRPALRHDYPQIEVAIRPWLGPVLLLHGPGKKQ